MKHIGVFCLSVLAVISLAACASTERSRSLPVQQTQAASRPYSGPRSQVVVVNIENKSGWGRGIFTTGADPLSGQAKTILMAHLQQTNRFIVLDRDTMEEARREAQILGESQNLIGAYYVITGDISEFGRRETGDHQLFGILGRGRRQVAYSKVTLNVVDVLSSAVVYSAQGAGEYTLSDREVLGFGSTSSYDSTLNGKVIDLAVREAVDRLAEGIDSGSWMLVSR